MSFEEIYRNKRQDYFNIARIDIINRIPKGSHRILEIGCGAGHTGWALKQGQKAMEVIGIELSEEAAFMAKRRIDLVLTGNVEEMILPFEKEQFDFIILGDVIEHLVDPWRIIHVLMEVLKPSGRIIATIPNVRNWKVVIPLVCKGQWHYQDWGLLDKGHIRFFTKESMRALFEKSGLQLIEIVPLLPIKSKSGKLNRVTFGLCEELLAPHYLISAEKRPE